MDEYISKGKSVFPEFTLEDKNKLSSIFSKTGNGILVSAFNVDIKKHDILTLENGRWLNDEIINFYAQLIMDRAKTKFLQVHVYNTFFYSTLSQGGYAKVRKWSKKVFYHSFIQV